MSDQTAQQGKGVQSVLASLEGQTLYELYVQGLASNANLDRAWPLGVTTLENDTPQRKFLQWKDLSPMRKSFWQRLAMDFLKVAA